ncbi:MAG: hypothetical protein AB8B94_00900 [Hyphomicrobiales bacterium]
MTSRTLAPKTSLTERYLREGLNNQVAGGYLVYDKLCNLICFQTRTSGFGK